MRDFLVTFGVAYAVIMAALLLVFLALSPIILAIQSNDYHWVLLLLISIPACIALDVALSNKIWDRLL